MNFWENLKKPIMILAPMEDVTDTVFRQIVNTVGRPDVVMTEFTSTDAMCSPGLKRVSDRLEFDSSERPVVAQIWGTDPEKFTQAAKIISKMGFDGIDINMGCPVRDVTKTGACSALIKTPLLAKQIIEATKLGAPKLPISVKTRIGFNEIDTENWVKFLLEQNLSALTLHFRTAKEMSKVPAHWEEAQKAVAVRNQLQVKTLIIGNGDVKSLQEAHDKAAQYQLDGIMIGRGIFENVWIFNPDIKIEEITLAERLALLQKHIELFEKTWGNAKNFAILKKFVKCYINGFSGASELRVNLMETKSLTELKTKITKLISNQQII